jgi:hypothetical protein
VENVGPFVPEMTDQVGRPHFLHWNLQRPDAVPNDAVLFQVKNRLREAARRMPQELVKVVLGSPAVEARDQVDDLDGLPRLAGDLRHDRGVVIR